MTHPVRAPRFSDNHGSSVEQMEHAAKKAYAEWLGGREWDHWVTLTFKYPRSEEAVVRHARRWLRRIEGRVQHGLSWFYVVELNTAGERHVHLLTRGTWEAGGEVLKGAWNSGLAHAEAYDPQRGAAYYITKDVGDKAEHYDFHLRKPAYHVRSNRVA